MYTKFYAITTMIVFIIVQGVATSYAGEHKIVSPDQFAILAWGKAPAELEAFSGIHECGFNLTLTRPGNVPLAAQAGLYSLVDVRLTKEQVFLEKKEIEHQVKEILQENAHETVYGYCLYDEPGKDLFPGLAAWVAAFRKAAPEVVSIINLFPNYATPEQLQTATYDEYLAAFTEIVKPDLLCYDHYALMEDGSVAETAYFQNLESVRAEALRRNIPFWNVVISQGCLGYAVPTDAGMRFQLYTTMAYGARGIVYWRYFAPARGNYRMAPIDQFGHRTPTWYIQQHVNLQTQQLAQILATLKSLHVFHHPEVPPDGADLASSHWIQSLEGGSFLVGEFEGPESQPVVMVVNKSIQRSAPVSIALRPSGQVLWINPFTGDKEPWQGENIWLAPGQGVLLLIE